MRSRRFFRIALAFLVAVSLSSCLPAFKKKGEPGAEEARAAYRAIVKNVKKPQAERNPLFDEFVKKVGEFIKKIVEWAVDHRLAVLAGAGLVVVGFIALALWKRGRPRMPRKGVQRKGKASPGSASAAERIATLEELLAEADGAAASGDFSAAAVFIHRASVRYLTNKGIIAAGRSYGNADICSILGKRGGGRAEFALAARAAERAVFGRRVLEEHDWNSARTAAYELMGAA